MRKQQAKIQTENPRQRHTKRSTTIRANASLKKKTQNELKNEIIEQPEILVNNKQVFSQKTIKKSKKVKKTITFKVSSGKDEDTLSRHQFIHSLKQFGFRKQQFGGSSLLEKFPQSLTTILYGQNIHNYNPYIEALTHLESLRNEGKIGLSMGKNIEKLCHIGVAKNFLKLKRYRERPKYSRVNILIRDYMYENMTSVVEEKAQHYENIVFVPCNPTAMSFNANSFPQKLREVCSKHSYQRVIHQINSIIERNFLIYKTVNTPRQSEDSWTQNLSYFLTAVFLLSYILSEHPIFILLFALATVVLLVCYGVESYQDLNRLGTSKNIIPKISEEIRQYFAQINTRTIEWRLGEDFYWIEIYYIKKKRKRIDFVQ